MGFKYLLRTNVDVESFKARLNIPRDVNISYCHEGVIEDQRLPYIVFFFRKWRKKSRGADDTTIESSTPPTD